MIEVVSDTTTGCNTLGGIFYHANRIHGVGKYGMSSNSRFKPTFIRQWRQHRGLSLDQLADRIPMDKSNLSKVERGKLPYNQEMLERLADALMTDVASLLMRDPSDSAAIWSLWDRASMIERRQIENVVTALVSDKKRA